MKTKMGLNEWLALLGTLGGFEAIKWAVIFFANRKTDVRKADATADSLENENERKQIAWLEERISQRDTKIDALYIELRKEQSDKLQLVHEKHNLELKLKESDMKKCDVRGCGNRQPPSDY